MQFVNVGFQDVEVKASETILLDSLSPDGDFHQTAADTCVYVCAFVLKITGTGHSHEPTLFDVTSYNLSLIRLHAAGRYTAERNRLRVRKYEDS